MSLGYSAGVWLSGLLAGRAIGSYWATVPGSFGHDFIGGPVLVYGALSTGILCLTVAVFGGRKAA